MSFKNRFREWLSDNLRYLVLGIGILVVVAAIFFGVWLLTSSMNKNKSDGADSGTSQESTPTPTPEEAKEPDTNSDSAPEGGEEDAGVLKKNDNPEITALMNQYYTALGGKNMDVLQKVVDNLSEEEQASITGEANIEGYSDISTYTFQGQQEGTYVVIVSFNCKYKEIDTSAPGLSQMYVYTNGDGKLVIAAEVEDEDVNTYMKDIQNQPEVKTLIEETQEAYEAARASDAKLDALIASVAGA